MTKDKININAAKHSLLSGECDYAYKFLGSFQKNGKTKFRVYAPNADKCSVKAFGQTFEMVKKGGFFFLETGIDICSYTYIIEKDGKVFEKTDPFSFHKNQVWKDEIKTPSALEKMPDNLRIYELHAGSWIEKGNFAEIGDKLAEYVKAQGYNCVELMPVHSHPCNDSWGYQTGGYFSFQYGTPSDFADLVDKLHKAEIAVIVDFVPGHFAIDAEGLSLFDGTHLFEADDPEIAENKLWGTFNTDFEKPFVRSFMLSSASYLADVFKIDGIRVDAVSNMLFKGFEGYGSICFDDRFNIGAVEFIKTFTDCMRKKGVLTIAEDCPGLMSATKSPHIGGLGFDRVWNTGWYHDTVTFMSAPPNVRPVLSSYIRKTFDYMNNEKYILPLSHDENVHGKRSIYSKFPDDGGSSFRLFMTYMASFPGDKLMFMGTDAGLTAEWDGKALGADEPHSQSVREFCQKLNQILSENSSAFLGFELISFENGVLSFLRKGSDRDDFLLFVFNFTDTEYPEYSIGTDRFVDFREILVTSDRRKTCVSYPDVTSWDNRLFRTKVNLPPLCGLILKPDFSWKKS